jgi:hypothetical protein
MKVTKTAAVFLVAAVVATAPEAKEDKHPLDDYVLTDEMIAEAIKEGRKTKVGIMGLTLKDSRSSWVRLPSTASTTGFSLEIYTPYSWVGEHARRALRGEKDFTVEDVTDEMVKIVLRIIANPDVPKPRQGARLDGTSGVDHVIIRSTAKEDFEVLQPLTVDEDVIYISTGGVPYRRKTAVFDIDAAAEIGKLDRKGEFFVVVIGTTGEEKNFKVKTKHFERLR